MAIYHITGLKKKSIHLSTKDVEKQLDKSNTLPYKTSQKSRNIREFPQPNEEQQGKSSS